MTDPLYQDFDAETDLRQMTLCADCAKDLSLRRFVQQNSLLGPVCGVCQGVEHPYPACDTARKDDLTNLIKALVRFHYNEYEYNRHFGGNEPEELLGQLNPILAHATDLFHSRSPDQSCDFLYDLFASLPYPPLDKGVSIYAGCDDEGTRHLNFAIKDSQSPLLMELRARLAKENPFDVEPTVETLIDQIGSRIDKIVPAGTTFFRARIGTAARWYNNAFDWKAEIFHQPFQANQLGAPPPPLATAGRLNREGVAFLYLASEEHTAAAEVRPHPGHQLSIGQYRATRDLRIAAFEADIANFCGSERDLDLFHFIHSMDKVMAQPVLPGATGRYTITQLVADCLRRRKFDGVSFRSSVADGLNLCAYRPDTFSYVEGSAVVKSVKSLSYTLDDAPMRLHPEDNDIKWPD